MAQISSGLTRRALIERFAVLGGAGAAYMALSTMGLLGGGAQASDDTTEALPNGSMAGKRIVVIGAGVAGLCSALRLARAGAEVEILEATGRSGGRSLTLRHGDSYSEWDWNSPTTMQFEQVGDMKPEDPDNYLNAGPGRIPQHHERVIDYCKMLDVELQPYIYTDSANLLQNDDWNGGRPVQLRRLKNELRGHVAELMAKVSDKGALDRYVDASDTQALLGMLSQFGQLTGDGAQMFYAGAAFPDDYPRAGYRIQPGDVSQPGTAWPTLSLDEVLDSDFWSSEMFNDLEFFWQATLMQPVDGMDKIVDGFLRAEVPGGKTLGDLVVHNQPVLSIDLEGEMSHVTTASGTRAPADFVIATLTPPLLAGLKGNFLDATFKQILASVDVTPACKVGWQGRSRFWEEEDRIYGGISWTKDIITQIWYPSYGFNSPTGVLTGAYLYAGPAKEFGALSREERLETALTGGEKLHPGFRDKVFADKGVTIAWAKMPYQAGGWAHETSFLQPEVFEEMVHGESVARNVFFAGDWFSYWPGWQEGSLDSAHLATDRIARIAADRG
ncbi:MAG: FAD-dependent oxidoreductase [Alphaproteobacteria bacterium]